MKSKLVILLLIIGNPIFGKAIPLNPFKKALDDLSNRASMLLDRAVTGGQILESNAANEALSVIAQTKDAYKDALNATSHQITSKEQQVLNGISGVLDQVQTNTIDGAEKKITEVMLMLPFFDKQPQVTTWTGNVIGTGEEFTILHIHGVFKDAAKAGYEPDLQVKDILIPPFEKTNQELSFKVPTNAFPSVAQSLNPVAVNLKIPYDPGFFHSKVIRQFSIGFLALPSNSGIFKLFQSTSVETTISQQRSCQIRFAGHEEAIRGCPIDQGWSVIPENARLELVHEDGKGFGHDHWDLGWAISPGTVARHIRTDGDNSALIYNIYFVEKKQQTLPIDSPLADEQLKWGDSKVYTISADDATFKAIYIDPAGHQIGFATTNQSNPYIHIKQIGNQLVVSMAPFQ
ncbi:MAG TPA: hypothetical protein VK787_06645 [Puia sp.]|jgi:hypothetical protein|nr:hypothetical protein [Puia sp.]